MLFAPEYVGLFYKTKIIALHASIPFLDLRPAAPRLAFEKNFSLLWSAQCLLPASLRLQTGRLLHTPIISIRGEGGGAPSREPLPLGLSGRRSRPPRRRFPGLGGGSRRNGRPGLGGGVRGVGQSAASGVRLPVQDCLQVLSSGLALDAPRRGTWRASEVCAAVGALLLATAAFVEQNQS